MRRVAHRFVLLMIVSLLLHAGAHAGAWYYDQIDTDTALNGLCEGGDVWYACGPEGAVFKNDGTGWSGMTTPVTAGLTAIDAASAGNVWAVGADGTVLYYDGSSWTQDTLVSDTYGSLDFSDVFVLASGGTKNVYITGGDEYDSYGIVLHRVFRGSSGSQLADESMGSVNALDLSTFYGSSASRPGSVWAASTSAVFITASTKVLKWNGSSWSDLNINSLSGNNILRDVWGTASDSVWVSGLSTLAHWDGSTWTSADYYTKWDSYHGIAGTGANDIYVAGTDQNTDGIILHYSGGYWSQIKTNVSGSGIGLAVPRGTDLAAIAYVYGNNLIRYSETGSIPGNPNGGPGTLRWGYATGASQVGPVAVGADDTVYAGAKDGGFHAIADGVARWSVDLGYDVNLPPTIGDDGTVYVAAEHTYSEGRLIALDAQGQELWSWKPEGVEMQVLKSSPTIHPAGLLLTSYYDQANRDYFLAAVTTSGATGATLPVGGEAWSTVASDGTILVGADDGNRSSISPKMVVLGADGTLERYYTGTDVHPVIGPGNAYYMSSYKNELVAYVNAPASDYESWSQDWAYPFPAKVTTEPAVESDGTIYVGVENGKLYALDATGSLGWSFDCAAYHDSGYAAVSHAPALGADGTVFVGDSNGNLFAIRSDGTLKWRYAMPAAVSSCPAIDSDGSVIVSAWDGMVYAINSDCGGLADAPWPRFGGDNRNTGRSRYTPVGKTSASYVNVRIHASATTLRSGKTLVAGVYLMGTVPPGAQLYATVTAMGNTYFLPYFSTAPQPMQTYEDAFEPGYYSAFSLYNDDATAALLGGKDILIQTALMGADGSLLTEIVQTTVRVESAAGE